jgi:hypothetical protein
MRSGKAHRLLADLTAGFPRYQSKSQLAYKAGRGSRGVIPAGVRVKPRQTAMTEATQARLCRWKERRAKYINCRVRLQTQAVSNTSGSREIVISSKPRITAGPGGSRCLIACQTLGISRSPAAAEISHRPIVRNLCRRTS